MLFNENPLQSSGSITFAITPGGDIDNESLEPLVPLPLFATQSPAGDRDFRFESPLKESVFAITVPTP